MRNWRVVSASEAGSGHIARGIGCQDAHGYRLLSNGALSIAVADGAGSARLSANGAALAVKSSLEFLSGRDFEDARNTASATTIATALKSAASVAREAIARHCRTIAEAEPDSDVHVAQFATTLLLLYLDVDVSAVLQIGDGAVVIQSDDDNLEVLTTSGHEDYVNETTFLTSERAIEDCGTRIDFDRVIRAVTVMTDGMQLLGVDHSSNTAFKPFFGPLFRFARDPSTNDNALAEFLRSERVCERTDDDKTLVIAVQS
jgi:serine/threonine protein phosphatase PrpC